MTAEVDNYNQKYREDRWTYEENRGEPNNNNGFAVQVDFYKEKRKTKKNIIRWNKKGNREKRNRGRAQTDQDGGMSQKTENNVKRQKLQIDKKISETFYLIFRKLYI